MIPSWNQVQASELASIRGVAFDIDDTFSSHGKILPEAYAALWELKRAGYWLVPITGRPAGWCDHIARFWPVDAVVGENGAFVFEMKEGVRTRLNTPGLSADPRAKLEELGRVVRARFPLAVWASDQAYRESDLAIDFCEDVKPWSESDIAELVAICRGQGAHAKVSSIHVNAWFGEYDKNKGFSHWLSQRPDAPRAHEWIFVGDSPNDEPMFGAFDHSVGVANLKKFEGSLKHPPRWITQSESGLGFVEVAKSLLLKPIKS
jgi:HAD superfamily hydrolase (TIGR01484 family)